MLIPLIFSRVGAGGMLPRPDVWTAGSAFAGAGVFARLHVDNWRHQRWGQFDDLGLTPVCWFQFFACPLQTFQRAEFWGVILAGHECCSSGC